jgi:predicted small metal-binding protein
MLILRRCKMKEQLYVAKCDPVCGFAIQGHDKKEVAKLVKAHGKEVHKMDMPDKEAEKYVKKADGTCMC